MWESKRTAYLSYWYDEGKGQKVAYRFTTGKIEKLKDKHRGIYKVESWEESDYYAN